MRYFFIYSITIYETKSVYDVYNIYIIILFDILKGSFALF